MDFGQELWRGIGGVYIRPIFPGYHTVNEQRSKVVLCMTYVSPRWDDIHLSSVRPISSNLSDGPGFKHSVSSSCSSFFSETESQICSADNVE